jgi:hypothetical protein
MSISTSTDSGISLVSKNIQQLNISNVLDILEKSRVFNKTALFSSFGYFLILSVLLIMILTEKITDDMKYKFDIALIVTLILPMVFFAIMGRIKIREKNIIGKYQKLVLCIYFLLVLISLSGDLANIDQTYLTYFKIYILPFLVLFSFYEIYTLMIGDKPQPKSFIALLLCLSLLYYTSFYDNVLVATKTDSEAITGLTIVELILTILLSGLFLYSAVTWAPKS